MKYMYHFYGMFYNFPLEVENYIIPSNYLLYMKYYHNLKNYHDIFHLYHKFHLLLDNCHMIYHIFLHKMFH